MSSPELLNEKRAKVFGKLDFQEDFPTTVDQSAILSVSEASLAAGGWRLGDNILFCLLAFGSMGLASLEFFAPQSYKALFDDLDLFPLLALILVTWGTAIYLKGAKGLERKRKFAVGDSLNELKRIAAFVARKLDVFNERSNKYFHSLTYTKVTSIFVLMQLQTTLNEKVSELEGYFARGRKDDLQNAAKLLQGGIVLKENTASPYAKTHVVPFSRLSATVASLFEEVDRALSELEAETTAASPSENLSSTELDADDSPEKTWIER